MAKSEQRQSGSQSHLSTHEWGTLIISGEATELLGISGGLDFTAKTKDLPIGIIKVEVGTPPEDYGVLLETTWYIGGCWVDLTMARLNGAAAIRSLLSETDGQLYSALVKAMDIGYKSYRGRMALPLGAVGLTLVAGAGMVAAAAANMPVLAIPAAICAGVIGGYGAVQMLEGTDRVAAAVDRWYAKRPPAPIALARAAMAMQTMREVLGAESDSYESEG